MVGKAATSGAREMVLRLAMEDSPCTAWDGMRLRENGNRR